MSEERLTSAPKHKLDNLAFSHDLDALASNEEQTQVKAMSVSP